MATLSNILQTSGSVGGGSAATIPGEIRYLTQDASVPAGWEKITDNSTVGVGWDETPSPCPVALDGGSLAQLPGRRLLVHVGSTVASGNMYVYEFENDSWGIVNDCPTAGKSNGMMCVLPSGLIFLGITGTSTAYLYNPTNTTILSTAPGQWRATSAAPIALGNGGAVTMTSNAVIGGSSVEGSVMIVQGNGTNTVLQYIPQTNVWSSSTFSTLPSTSNFGGACVLPDGRVFYARASSTGNVYIYEPSSNSWISSLPVGTPGAQITDAPVTTGNADVVSFSDNTVLFISDRSGGFANDTWLYNVANNTWDVLPRNPSQVGCWGGGLAKIDDETVICSNGHNEATYWTYYTYRYGKKGRSVGYVWYPVIYTTAGKRIYVFKRKSLYSQVIRKV
jgi:hypothetical protein